MTDMLSGFKLVWKVCLVSRPCFEERPEPRLESEKRISEVCLQALIFESGNEEQTIQAQTGSR